MDMSNTEDGGRIERIYRKIERMYVLAKTTFTHPAAILDKGFRKEESFYSSKIYQLFRI